MGSACCRGAAPPAGADLTNATRRTIAAIALILLSAGLAVAAIVLPGQPGTRPAPTAHQLPVEPFDPPVTGAPIAPRPSRPTGLVIPALGVRAPVVPLAAEGEVLTPPGDVSEVGWWRAGRRPGARRGNVLITGHTVHTGGGVFDNLGDLRVGDPIQVDTRTFPIVYRVVEVRYLTVPQLAKEAPDLFAHDGPSRLVLVTCAGWDGAQYAYHGNTVVIAEPMTTRHAHPHPSSSPTAQSVPPAGPAQTPSATPTAPSTPPSTPPSTAVTPGAASSSVLEPPSLPYWYPCQECNSTAPESVNKGRLARSD
ncbi:MAG TPA: sortase [Nocardioides sp.]|nr:sortase [Nocardioides sp.]